MSALLVALCYGSATLISLFLLWHFGVQRWYWHGLSVIAALVLGLMRMPSILGTQYGTLVVGWIFTVLFFWGVAAPLFAHRHRVTSHAAGRP
jgi:hypothetical protein